MALDDFLKNERSEGKSVGGEATFTLDPNKVRERVGVFTQADSLYPMYRCLQAIIQVCKGDIFIQRENRNWQFSFRWDDSPTTQIFDDLLNLGTTAGFDRVGHRVGQHLFFGLSAALGTPDYSVAWAGPKAHFTLENNDFSAHPPETSDYTKLTFSLDSSWWKRITSRHSANQIKEQLEYRVSYSPKPIHLDRERLTPGPPIAPERPWSSKLVQGSQLAWRYIRKPDQNLMTIPYPVLDHYRTGNDGETFHLIREPESESIPLSVAFQDPLRKNLKKGQTKNLSLSLASRVHSGLFLSLESGRQDWFIPVSDGVLTEPIATKIAGGGIVALSSEAGLQYDLSGLKVVQNDAFNTLLLELQKESKLLKRQLAVSVANMSVRAKKLPRQYDQALSYLVGGPVAGLWGGRFGPKVRQFLSRGEE